MTAHSIIDDMLADFRPERGTDPTISAGIRRGDDFKALSERADQGLLDDLFDQGEHRMARSQLQNRSGLVAASANWRQSPAQRKAQETTYDAQPHTQDDLPTGNPGQFKDAGLDDSIMGEMSRTASAQDPQNLADLGKPHVSPGDIRQFVTTQLALGKTPSQVFAALKQRATQEVFEPTMNHELLKDQSHLMGMDYHSPDQEHSEAMGTDRHAGLREAAAFLQKQAGLLGHAYIEPNQFNKNCKASLAYIRANGQLRAASVKEIAACKGCSECKCGPDGKKKCATYNRPIVSNEKDLARVVASLTEGTMKKAALVAKHNGVTAAADTPGHSTNVIASRQAPAAPQQIAGHTAGISRFDAQEFRTANSAFSPAAVMASLNEGVSFARIFAAAKLEHGTQAAERTCRAYLDGLKGSGARINLASLDCSLLKRRLASSETILGAEKCASCTLRGGMHCGLTGGTLLSFPGMGKGSDGRKTAAMTPQVRDGVETMQDLGMAEPELVIELKGPRNLMDVEVPGVPGR